MKRTLAIGLLPCLLLGLTGCHRLEPAGHSHGGHSHGGHEHDDHGHGEEEGESASFTLYTETHELFVELDLPAAGARLGHLAHVTRLADNAPARSGGFGVAWLDADEPARVVESHAVSEPWRTGIFELSGTAPEAPGRYRLVYRFQDGETVAEWDAGALELGREAGAPPSAPEGEITFLKETAWSLPFRVQRPERRPLSRTVTLPAHVEADPRLTTSLAAPAAGRVLWSSGETATLRGSRVEAGEVIGRLVPDSSYVSWNALDLEVRRARIDRDRAEAELERLESLLGDGLVAEKRVLDTRAERDRAEAALRSARRELDARRGEAPAVELRAPQAGVVVERLVEHGERAEAGRPLARIASADRVLIHGTVRGVRPEELERIRFARALALDSPHGLDLLDAGAALLSRPGLVDRASAGLPVTWSLPNDGSLLLGELLELTLGIGEPEEHLTVPLGAVVEINTRPHAFVQVTGESFEQRRLALGVSDGERVAVLEGLAAEDRVVVEGGFEVYAASLAGTVESHHH